MSELIDLTVREVKNNIMLRDSIDFLENNYVLIGIPEKTTDRQNSDNEDTNAQILYLNTNGSPINNIPARPVLEPALEDDKENIEKRLEKVFDSVVNGEKDKAKAELEKLGMAEQNKVRSWFVDDKNGWPPNSCLVQKEKRRKGSTNPRPLIDTGELRKSITYIVVEDGRRK